MTTHRRSRRGAPPAPRWAAARSALGKAAAAVQADATRQAALEGVRFHPDFQTLTFASLRSQAIEAQRARARGDFSWSGECADAETVHRWMVNYARHDLTSYDATRITHRGQVGVQRAAEDVRDAVLGCIEQRWPALRLAVARARRNE